MCMLNYKANPKPLGQLRLPNIGLPLFKIVSRGPCFQIVRHLLTFRRAFSCAGKGAIQDSGLAFRHDRSDETARWQRRFFHERIADFCSRFPNFFAGFLIHVVAAARIATRRARRNRFLGSEAVAEEDHDDRKRDQKSDDFVKVLIQSCLSILSGINLR